MTHRIYFAQHGLAVEKAEDPERPLSQAGIDQSKAIAKTLRDSKTPTSRIFHSGKLRAQQTAEIFADVMNISAVSALDGLSPNDDVALVTQSLKVNNAFYVGHLPHLDKLTAFLVTGAENRSIIKFQNSAVVCLEKSDDFYQLQWYLTPELIHLA